MRIPTILLLLAIGLNQFAKAQNRVVIGVGKKDNVRPTLKKRQDN